MRRSLRAPKTEHAFSTLRVEHPNYQQSAIHLLFLQKSEARSSRRPCRAEARILFIFKARYTRTATIGACSKYEGQGCICRTLLSVVPARFEGSAHSVLFVLDRRSSDCMSEGLGGTSRNIVPLEQKACILLETALD